MSKRIKDTSKKLPKINPKEIAKALGAERVTPLEEIIDNDPNYIPVGNPLLMQPPPFLMLEHAVHYLAGRCAAYNNTKREDIVAYRLLSYDEFRKVAKELGVTGGLGIQFYTKK